MNWDNFDDIRGATAGVLEGEALDAFDSVESNLLPSGLVSDFHCRGCGASVQLTTAWHELIALGCGISPHLAYSHPKFQYLHLSDDEWKVADWRCGRCWKSMGVKCSKCERRLYILITSERARSYVDAGRGRGWVPKVEDDLREAAMELTLVWHAVFKGGLLRPISERILTEEENSTFRELLATMTGEVRGFVEGV